LEGIGLPSPFDEYLVVPLGNEKATFFKVAFSEPRLGWTFSLVGCDLGFLCLSWPPFAFLKSYGLCGSGDKNATWG
jgi:hypothetical protein